MKAKFKSEKRIDPNILLGKIKEISTLNEDNKIVFNDIKYEKLEWTFLSLIDFGGLYNIESKKFFLLNTFEQLVINNKFDNVFFYEILNNQIEQHNKKQEKDYYLLTSLSVKELPIKKITIGNCKILFTGKQFPKKFKTHRNSIHKTHTDSSENNDYLKIVVAIRDRDFKDAYEKAYRSFEVFRAMLCLILNSEMELHFGSHSGSPINKVRQGEFSSLHLENGTCANNNYYWYEPNFKAAKLLEFNVEKRGKFKTNIKWLIKSYNLCTDKHKYTLGKALNIYASAYDESNKYICFLRAWTALETILNTDQNDILIKRCIAIYHEDDRLFQKQILEGLRSYRNEFVHEGNNGLDPFVACFTIQGFIYNLVVRFNFRYAGIFNTIDEAIMFLDNYSLHLKELKIRKKFIDRAIDLKEKIRRTNNSS